MELGCSHDGAAPAKNSTVPRTRRVPHCCVFSVSGVFGGT